MSAITHTINSKPSGIIQPDTPANRAWVIDFWRRSDAHYERKKPTVIKFKPNKLKIPYSNNSYQ